MSRDWAASEPADLPQRLDQVRARIRAAEQRYGREAGSVRLLAVSKRHSPDAIRSAAAAGQQAFGENYLAEAQEKMDVLHDLALEWHFIGPIQSNKTSGIASRFDWVQSIDREKILRRLADQRPDALPPLQCLIQVRIGDEASKSGVAPNEVERLADLAESLPRLRLRGLMSIPPPTESVDQQRRQFRQLKQCFERAGGPGRGWDVLSMGMSADLEAAIAEGATLVRVGTDIFGPR